MNTSRVTILNCSKSPMRRVTIPKSAPETVLRGHDELMSVFLPLCPLLLLEPQLECDLLSLELNSELDWGGVFSSDNLDGGGETHREHAIPGRR